MNFVSLWSFSIGCYSFFPFDGVIMTSMKVKWIYHPMAYFFLGLCRSIACDAPLMHCKFTLFFSLIFWLIIKYTGNASFHFLITLLTNPVRSHLKQWSRSFTIKDDSLAKELCDSSVLWSLWILWSFCQTDSHMGTINVVQFCIFWHCTLHHNVPRRLWNCLSVSMVKSPILEVEVVHMCLEPVSLIFLLSFPSYITLHCITDKMEN